jgi:hypothetical protein
MVYCFEIEKYLFFYIKALDFQPIDKSSFLSYTLKYHIFWLK